MEIYKLSDIYYSTDVGFDWVKNPYINLETKNLGKNYKPLINLCQPTSLEEMKELQNLEVTPAELKNLEESLNNLKMGKMYLTRVKSVINGKEYMIPVVVEYSPLYSHQKPVKPIIKTELTIGRDIPKDEKFTPLAKIFNLEKIGKLTPKDFEDIIKKISTKKFAKAYNAYLEKFDEYKQDIHEKETALQESKQAYNNHKDAFEKIEL